MKRALQSALIVLVSASFLGACEQVKETFGVAKRAPDEFAVYSRDPLAVPAEFSLPEPAPGSRRPQLVTPRDKVLRVLLGRRTVAVLRAQNQPASDGTRQFLAELGTDIAQPGIRNTVAAETLKLAEEDKTWGEAIRFWATPTEYGVMVDPKLEAKRIQENKALGRPMNTGTVPVIEEKRGAILEGLL